MLGLQQSLSELMRKNCKDNDFATLYRSDFRYFPKGFFPKCILPSGDFPNVKFPKRQLPESVLAAALPRSPIPSQSQRSAPNCSLRHLRGPNLTTEMLPLGKLHIFGKLPLGKLSLGKLSLGKSLLGKCLWESTQHQSTHNWITSLKNDVALHSSLVRLEIIDCLNRVITVTKQVYLSPKYSFRKFYIVFQGKFLFSNLTIFRLIVDKFNILKILK